MNQSPEQKAVQVRDTVRAVGRLLVAYSGGVDSTVLLALATEAEDARIEAVIADSPSLPRAALRQAIEVASTIGVRPVVLATHELENPDYSSNPPNRCYFCKAELFSRMEAYAREHGFNALAYGENSDDMRQVRPGRAAAEAFSVLAPLRDAGLTKSDIRELARNRGLPNWSAPAQPCLSSRIPHGIPVTPEALARVEAGEAAVRSFGFLIFRVRHTAAPGELPAATLQVAPAELDRARQLWPDLESALQIAGFAKAELDPAGYRSTAAP